MSALKTRKVRDLLFLLNLPTEHVSDDITIRREVAGTDKMISEFMVPIDIYVSYDKYSYDGRLLETVIKAKMRNYEFNPSEIFPFAVIKAIKTMKLYQRVWINVKKLSNHQINKPEDSGYHYNLTIDEIKFKNNDTYQAKALFVQQQKEEAKKYVSENNYEEASRKYRSIINATQGLDKKRLKCKKQIHELTKINESSKENYLKCFIKVKYPDEKLVQEALTFANDLLKLGVTSQRLSNKAYIQAMNKRLADALETAKILLFRDKEQGERVIEHIKRKMCHCRIKND